MKMQEGYAAFKEELPGANTQGETLDEARENLREAIKLVLAGNRALAEHSLDDDARREQSHRLHQSFDGQVVNYSTPTVK